MGDAAIHVYSPAAAPPDSARSLSLSLSPLSLSAGAVDRRRRRWTSLSLCARSVPRDRVLARRGGRRPRARRRARRLRRAQRRVLPSPLAIDPSKRAAAILLGHVPRQARRRTPTLCPRLRDSRNSALVALVKPDKDARSLSRRALRRALPLDSLDRAASPLDVPLSLARRRPPSPSAPRRPPRDGSTPTGRSTTRSLAADALALIRAALHGHPAALRPRVDARANPRRDDVPRRRSRRRRRPPWAVVATPRAGAVAGSSAGESAVADAATAWSSLARRIAIAAHDVLDVALRGAGPWSASSSARAAYSARRDQTPPPFGGG